MTNPHKHAFVGVDLQGDACIYVLHIDAEGNTGGHFSERELRKIADRINDMPDTLAKAVKKGVTNG